MSVRQISTTILKSFVCLSLAGVVLNRAQLPSAAAQTCGAQGVAAQVLGSGGPELQDKRASSSYLVWESGQARVLVDAGGGSELRFADAVRRPLRHELNAAAVECPKRRAMANGDDRGSLEPILQQMIERCLGGLVECRRDGQKVFYHLSSEPAAEVLLRVEEE